LARWKVCFAAGPASDAALIQGRAPLPSRRARQRPGRRPGDPPICLVTYACTVAAGIAMISLIVMLWALIAL
jgi:hypothetical protein